MVTDAQTPYARAELHKVGLLDYFDPIVVSGDHGFRKPDIRLFQLAVDGLGVAPEHTLYIGNDVYRDMLGAAAAGLKTALFNPDRGADSERTADYTISDHRELLGILGINN